MAHKTLTVVYNLYKNFILDSKRTYKLLQTMLNFIKYSDVKICSLGENMKAIRNMKDTIDVAKQQKEALKNKINTKLLDRQQRGSEIKTVN